MTTEHPITPPPELVLEWLADSPKDGMFGIAQHIATQGARWGADQELEACCAWLPKLPPWSADDLRKHRRPKPPTLKPPTLKQQALQALAELAAECYGNTDKPDTIRRALEQLND